jgi:hypothetical protein
MSSDPTASSWYGRSGSLQGETLLHLLTASVQDAGKILSEAEVTLLLQVVAAVESAEGPAAMAIALAPVLKISKTGELHSYSELATQVNSFFKDFATGGQESIDKALAAVASGNPRFEDVYTLVAAQESHKQFPQFSESLKTIRRGLARPAELKETAAEAKALYRARSFANSPVKRISNRARSAYLLVSKKYPGTEADQLAQAELAKLGAKTIPQRRPATPQVEKFRTWSDATGKFSIDAELIEFVDGMVKLKKRDGTELSLPEARLSEADQKYLKGRK